MSSAFTVPRPPDAVSRALVLLFLLGVYLGVAAHLPGGIPVPDVVAGAAGCLLLLTQAPRIEERHVVAIFAVLILYAVTVLAAPDYRYLIERFKGFVQLTYSVLIGYAFFLTVTRYRRSRLAAVFLMFSIIILIGCALENFTAFKDVSDKFRNWAFDTGVYTADLRDQLFYGRIRPKFFTSEPSAVAIMFALFSFAWYVLARARMKILTYLVLVGAGYFLMRGPSLLLGIALIPAYELLLASRRGPPDEAHIDLRRAASAVTLAVVIVGAAIPLVHALYANRLEAILSGEDPSFFSRVIAPPLVAFKVVAAHPIAGAGLTSWEFIDAPTREVYATAPWFSSDYRFDGAANAITNYFWLHWIYLGLFWGGTMIIALSLMLRSLAVPSILFCWIVWAVFGQGAGSYVGPQAWTVLFLAAALAVVHERSRVRNTVQATPFATLAPGAREPWLIAPPLTTGARP